MLHVHHSNISTLSSCSDLLFKIEHKFNFIIKKVTQIFGEFLVVSSSSLIACSRRDWVEMASNNSSFILCFTTGMADMVITSKKLMIMNFCSTLTTAF